MKIYIVTSDYDSEDYHIEAVFTKRTEAELYCARENTTSLRWTWDPLFIEELETEDLGLTKEIEYVYEFEETRLSDTSSTLMLTPATVKTAPVFKGAISTHLDMQPNGNARIQVVMPDAYSFDEATRIAEDILAKYKEEKGKTTNIEAEENE
jgi:hypothetical protein